MLPMYPWLTKSAPASTCWRTASLRAFEMRCAMVGLGLRSSRSWRSWVRSVGRGRLPVWVVRKVGMRASIPIPHPFEVSVEDVEYRPGLLARLYRPVGVKASVAILDVHGVAWVVGDPLQHPPLDEAMAANVALVASVHLRQPPGRPDPTSVVDGN